jgi:transposase
MRNNGLIGPDEEPSAVQIAEIDRKRTGKKLTNDEWESPSDPDARITKLMECPTHLAYNQEHVIDLESDFIVRVKVCGGSVSDHHALVDSLMPAILNLQQIGDGTPVIEEACADKGSPNNEQLERASALGVRTYLPEPDRPHPTKWTDKPAKQRAAVENNRRRRRGWAATSEQVSLG